MANGFYQIEDEDFLALPAKQQNLMMFKTFNTFRSQYEKDREERFTGCSDRMAKIEKKQKIEFGIRTGASAVSGAIGGFLASITNLFKG